MNSTVQFITNFFTKGHERSIRAKKNIAGSIVVKGFNIAIQLMLVPLTINYINPTQYGIWLTLSSLIAWFSFFDIGLGNGLRNRFTEASANEDYIKVRTYVSTTYAVLSIIFLFVFLLFSFICQFVDWSTILNAPKGMAAELNMVMLLVFGFFCLQMVFKTIGTILIADQKPAISALINMLGQLVSLVIIFILAKFTNGSLINLSFTLSIPPILLFISASIILFNNQYKKYAPSFSTIDFSITKDILGIGIKFFIIQIGVIILYQANNIIIAHICSLEDVVVYNISYKYMSISLMGVSIILSPFWSAFTEAFTLKDYRWMKNTLKKLNVLAVLTILGTILMSVSARFGYKLWIGDTVIIPEKITYTMGFYIILLSWTTIYVQILNGVGKIKIQLIIYIAVILLHIPTAIYLGQLLGVQGVIISASIFGAIMAVFSFIQVNKIINKREQGIWAQ